MGAIFSAADTLVVPVVIVGIPIKAVRKERLYRKLTATHEYEVGNLLTRIYLQGDDATVVLTFSAARSNGLRLRDTVWSRRFWLPLRILSGHGKQLAMWAMNARERVFLFAERKTGLSRMELRYFDESPRSLRCDLRHSGIKSLLYSIRMHALIDHHILRYNQ